MNNDANNIWNLYSKKNLILNEVSSSFVDEVKDAIEGKNLPFDNIFGDKLRVKIPMSGTKKQNEIISVISNFVKNYAGFDHETNEFIQKFKIDPKYGGGEKERRLGVGKAIGMMDAPQSTKDQYLELFSHRRFFIVLSRAPIDILRMSDVSTIRSCHSEDGSYFHCAVQEAKTGGPVAFLVKSDELAKLTPEEFQNEEIFSDKKRDLDGIEAVSRIRVRRYVNKNTGEEIGIPEVKLYGDQPEFFYEVLKNFLYKKQENILGQLEKLRAEFRNGDLVRTGGSYTDSSDAHIFNEMLNTTIFRGDLRHDANDEASENGVESRMNQFDEELAGFQRRFNLGQASAGYNVESSEDYVYYDAWGSITLELDVKPSEEFIASFGDITEHYQFEKLKNYDPNSQHSYRRELPYSMSNKAEMVIRFQKFYGAFRSIMKNFVEEMWSGMYIRKQGDEVTVTLNCCFGDDCSGTSHDTDDYLSFVRDLSDLDDEYEKLRMAFERALIVSGFAENSGVQIVPDEEMEERLQNLEMYDDPTELNYRGVIARVDPMKQQIQIIKTPSDYFLEKFLVKYIGENYKPKLNSDDRQMTFKTFMESASYIKNMFDYGIINVKCIFTNLDYLEKYKDSGYQDIQVSITIETTGIYTKELADMIFFIDDSFDTILNAIRYYLYANVFRLENQDTKNLSKVFRKYFI